MIWDHEVVGSNPITPTINRIAMTKDKKDLLETLVHKYQYSFKLLGDPTNSYNTLRLATFISTRKPREYQVIAIDDDRTLVFWNPPLEEKAIV